MQRITVETAKLAAEKGYRDNPWEEDYHKTAYQAELQDWLRTVHDIYVAIDRSACGWYIALQRTDEVFIKTSFIIKGPNSENAWDTYEEALEAGLQEALKLITS